MKKITNLIAVICLFAYTTQAQKVTIGPKLGVNFSTLTDVEEVESRVGLQAGGFLVYSIVEQSGKVPLDLD